MMESMLLFCKRGFNYLFLLLQDYLTNPVRIKVGKVSSPTANVFQILEKVPENDKVCLVLNLNSKENRLTCIAFNSFNVTIFCCKVFFFIRSCLLLVYIVV